MNVQRRVLAQKIAKYTLCKITSILSTCFMWWCLIDVNVSQWGTFEKGLISIYYFRN